MFNSLVQKLNKSFSSTKSDMSESPKSIKSESPEPQKASKKPDPQKPQKKKKICHLCKGVGCCTLCDKDDDWCNLIYCANKADRIHLVHLACDNLTEDLAKLINNYYCPNCRLDDKFQVTFYKKTSRAKQEEIIEILKSRKDLPKPENPSAQTSEMEKLYFSKVNDISVKKAESSISEKPLKNPENQVNSESAVINKAISVESSNSEVLKQNNTTPSEISDSSGSDSELSNSISDSLSKKSFQVSPIAKNNESFLLQVGNDSHTVESFSKDCSQNKSVSEENNSNIFSENEHDSFLSNFPGQESHKDILDTPKKANTSPNDSNLYDSYPSSTAMDSTEKQKLMETIKLLAKKLSDQNAEKVELEKIIENQKNEISDFQKDNEQKNDLKKIIQGQEDEIVGLQRESLKDQIVLDEAVTIINKRETELKDTKQKLKLIEEQNNELSKPLTLTHNEKVSYDPYTVVQLLKKESNLSAKKSTQIKNLVQEVKTYRTNLAELKNENEHLRLKVVNLTEEDIDKKILNFTIEENRRLECKIKIQKERNVLMGLEHKESIENVDSILAENLMLKEKLENIEKTNESLTLAGNLLDDGWETTSEPKSGPDDEMNSTARTNSPNSIKCNKEAKSSSPRTENKVEKLLIKVLEKLETPKTQNIDKTFHKTDTVAQGNGDNTGHSNKKQTCKFFLQHRCIFGDRCRNDHPKNIQQNRNYIPPWNTYPHQTSLSSRNQEQQNYSERGTNLNRGRHVGYWSHPHPPVPINETRFSHLDEVNLNDYNFPSLRN